MESNNVLLNQQKYLAATFACIASQRAALSRWRCALHTRRLEPQRWRRINWRTCPLKRPRCACD